MRIFQFSDSLVEYSYYYDERGRKIIHGEFKQRSVLSDSIIGRHFYFKGKLHGEYKSLDIFGGRLLIHCMYINGNMWDIHPDDIDHQERLLLQIQHPGLRFFGD